MAKSPLAKLEKLNLREYWESESGEFTPWLAENIRLLGEAIDLELEVEAQEKDVGPFRADLVCREQGSDHLVLIENQLEHTDHTHLGQLLTYAAGLEAATIIWVADRFTDEHRATLDWLNRITADEFNFFGIEIELWRIGESPLAPKFQVVSKPNEWTKTVQSSVRTVDLSDTKRLQLEYWTEYKKYLEIHSKLRCQKPLPHHWMTHSLGRSGFHLSAIASTWNSDDGTDAGEIRAQLVLNRQSAKQAFVMLEERKSEFERLIGEPLVWYNPPDKKVSRIFLKRSADILDRKDWEGQHRWLQQKLEKLDAVFRPIVAHLKLPDEDPPESEG